MNQDVKKQKRCKKFRRNIFFALAILLVMLIASSLVKRNSRYRMTMYDYDHILMEHEILRVIPIGSHVSDAKRIMEFNDFTCGRQTSDLLKCEQDNSSLICDFGLCNNWYVEISLKKGAVTSAKVWIQPAD